MEDIAATTTPNGRRRYPKTNNFRSQAPGADNIMISTMTDQVSLKGLEDVSDAASTVPMPLRDKDSDCATAVEDMQPAPPPDSWPALAPSADS
eukprot:6170867-Pyramimonas_sp.AAC.1